MPTSPRRPDVAPLPRTSRRKNPWPFLLGTRASRRGRPRAQRLFVELLEDRTLLAGSITGTVVNDLNGNTHRDPAEPPVAGASVYLDLNGNGKYDAPKTFTGSTSIHDLGGLDGATATVSGLSAQFTHITVNLNISRAAGSGVQWDVFLASPQGFNDGAGPELVPLPTGVGFNVTLDDAAGKAITSASPPYVGTYQPAQAFSDPSMEVYGTANPNGTWFLLFLDPNGNPVPVSGVNLQSWSLTFTQEPVTPTDANGHYSFPGLNPGTYKVNVAGTAASPDPGQTVGLATGQASATADFAVRTVLGSITGSVVNGGGQAVAGATAYLDLNHNGKYDAPVTFTGSTTIQDLGGLDGATLAVSGLSAQFTHVSVNLNIARAAGSGSQWDVFLASPQGFNDGAGPELVPMPTGVSFNVTLDDGAATAITSASSPYVGAFQPAQALSGSGLEVYGTADPNGVWYLLFLDPNGNPVPVSGVSILNWSLTFTQEPSTQTNANGDYNYFFTGLNPGTYTVGIAGAAAGPDPTRTVGVSTGHTSTGVNFTVQPAPDLVATSFQVAGGFATWGQSVTVNYTLANRGLGDAPAFDVDLRFASTDHIGGGDPLLQSIPIGPLPAGATTSGSVTVQLPGSLTNPPTGFGAFDPIYLGLVVDPANAVAETSESNNSNQGLGLDTALVTNAALTSDPGVQQQPTVVVDPHNPRHLVVAYMDYSLHHVTTPGAPAVGYSGIGVRTSADGGLTWTATSVPLPAGFDEAAGYPSLAFDDQGRLYVSFMAATFKGPQPPVIFPDGRDSSGTLFRSYGTQANNGIFLSYSNDGGLTWANPLPIVSHTYTPGGSPVPYETLPDLAIDRSALLPSGQPNPNYGKIYVTWSRFYAAGQMPGVSPQNGGSDILFASSADGGLTWLTPGQSAFNGRVSNSIAAGKTFVVNFTNRATGTLILNLTPGTNVTGGALMIRVFASNGSTILASATTIGSRTATLTLPVTSGQQVFLQVIGANSTAAGSFTLQVVNTTPLPALRDTEYKADGSAPPGGGSDDFSHLSIGPEGNVYVSLFRGGLFRVFGSTDGGTAFNTLGDPFGDNFSTFASSVLPDEDFRVFPVRDVLADPTRPGTLYALEAVQVTNPNFTPNTIDGGQVVFARSTDGGKTWSNVFTLNDDDGGRALGLATSLVNEVISGQVLPKMAVDGNGNLSVIWYDTRHDPANHSIDVFGLTSTDGGQTFSANYRVTNRSFDPNAGQFPAGSNDFFLGDGIGLAAAGGIDYAVWTDTRDGNQDVFFASYPAAPAPAPPNDRFEPNDTPPLATDLGTVSVPRVLPRLALVPGDEDWYRFTAAASGSLVISASATGGGAPQTVELWDATGGTLLTTATPVYSAGQVVGQQIYFAGQSGHTYLVHVTGLPSGATGVGYSLAVESLTADLGTIVHSVQASTLDAGAQAVYRAVAAVAGSMDVSLTSSASLVLQVLGPDGVTVVQTGQAVSIPVSAGQAVLVSVGGGGGYSLEFTNHDQFETSQNGTLFYPASGGTPSALAAADLNGDGHLDLVTAGTDLNNPVNVLLNNGNGTFGASAGFDAGPGATGSATGLRDLIVENFTTGTPDVVVSNYQAGTVSVLLGNGNGTLQPPRVADTTSLPDAMDDGDLNGDGFLDLAVLQRLPGSDGVSDVAVLFGRGNGTFAPPVLLPTTFTTGAGRILVGDFTGDHLDDIAVFGFNEATIDVFVNQGNGVFVRQVLDAPENVASALAADVNGDGHLDLILGGTNSGNVYVLFGNSDGTFQAPQTYYANTDPARTAASISGLALADIGGSTQVGTPDGPLDLIVTAIPRLGNGSPQLVLLPGHGDGTFGTARQLALGPFTGPVVAADLAGNGVPDVAAAVPGGVEVLYGKRPTIGANITQAAARDLGTVVHWVSPTQVIAPDRTDAWFTMTVPTEAVPGAGPEVIDFSARSQYADPAGGTLDFEVLDPHGTVLGSGQRFVVVAPQGEVLTLHVSGETAGGFVSAAYTLDIDVLPQVVSVAAPALLPGAGGPVTSLVVTLQGDRLNPATAEVPTNYVLTFSGPDGQTATFIPNGVGEVHAVVASPFPTVTAPDATSTASGQPVVYDPGANIDVASGLTYPTAVRQTVTLFFDSPLPAGSYALAVSPAVQAAPYNSQEAQLLVNTPDLTGHALASFGADHKVDAGGLYLLPNLVPQPAGLGDFTTFAAGTSFLTALHDNLGALLDAELTRLGDDPSITASLLAQAETALAPGSATAGQVPSFLVLVLDPVSLNLVDAQNRRATFDLKTNEVTSTQPKTYVEVGGNIEVVVVADVAGLFHLNISDVSQTARGGALVLSADGTQVLSLTEALRAGATAFSFDVPASLTAVPLGGPPEGPGTGSGGPSATASAAVSQAAAQASLAQPGTPIAVTEAPVNESGGATGPGGAGTTGPAPALPAVLPLNTGSGTGGSVSGALMNWVAQTFGPLESLLAEAGQALDVLNMLGMPAVVVPLRRAGEQLLRSLFRGLGGGLLGAPPEAPPAPPEEGALLPPAGGAPDPAALAEAPRLPPEPAPTRGSVLWLAAALAGGLLPVWREASARGRKRRAGLPAEDTSRNESGERGT